MWQTLKARDLSRDPPITVVTSQADRWVADGDLKLYGFAVEADSARRRAYAAAQEAPPRDPYHLFSLDVRCAGFISFGEKRQLWRWTQEGGLERLRHPGDNPRP